ncbi:MAG: methyltransferase domain-containing protein [Chloroflexi bacterium]|nr:methyltransferase domain-containing protein [Chloroflexota bacterium]
MTQSGNRGLPIHIGNVDWAESWRRKFEIRAAQPVGRRDWDDRAGRFAQMAADLDVRRDPLVRALAQGVRKEDTALDVGAGAGRFALPLAAMVSRVTAVEPSAGMRASLETALVDQEIGNVTVVPGTWQEVTVEPHDVALCAHVVYFVADIAPFIEKLDAAARRACYVYLRVEGNEAPLRPLWREIHGAEFPSEPGLADLYPLLLSLGIRANVRIETVDRAGYADLDAAVAQARQTLALASEQDGYDGRIREYLSEHLMERGGQLRFPYPSQTAVVWWEKD